MTIEIVDLPIDSMVIFHSFLYVYQRVFHHRKGHRMEDKPWKITVEHGL